MASEEPVELARCEDHGLVLLEDDSALHTFCAACEFDLEFRPDAQPGGEMPVTEVEFRQRLEADTVRELVPLMRAYLADSDEGPLWVTHLRWEGNLPAGYTEQERFVLAVGYRWGSMGKHITSNPSARQTVETLHEAGFGAAEEVEG